MRTSISAPALAVLSGNVVPMALLVDMAFSPVVSLASSAVSILAGATLYTGAGSLGAVEPVRDAPGDSQGLRFTLSGVPSDNLALAMQEDVRGRAVTVKLAVLDPATHAVLDSPTLWAGTLDQMPISRGAQTSTIGVTALHRGVTFRMPKPLRYTDNDQQVLVPGDTSLRYVLSQSQHQDIWPAASFFRQ